MFQDPELWSKTLPEVDNLQDAIRIEAEKTCNPQIVKMPLMFSLLYLILNFNTI